MYLLLGDRQDPLCESVRQLLAARSAPTLVVANPLMHPARFSWHLDTQRSVSRLEMDGQPPLTDGQIAGVLVRSVGWIDPAGWEPSDFAYVQTETQAALLAWLHSLPCPVINRYSAATWHGGQTSLLFWRPLLRRAGLPALETLVTNVAEETLAFRRRGTPFAGAAVYGPLTSEARYLIVDDAEWEGLAALQRCAPVCMTDPHGAAHFVFVAEDRVFWNGGAPPELTAFDPALRAFARAADLSCVELAFAATPAGMRVIAVQAHPRFEHFDEGTREQIAHEIVRLLTPRMEEALA